MFSKFQPYHLHGWFLLIVLTCVGNIAHAQGVPVSVERESASTLIELEEPGSKEAVRELVSTLSDNDVRNLLIQRLDAVAAAKQSADTADTGVITIIRNWFENYFGHARRAVGRAGEIPSIISALGTSFNRALSGSSSVFLLVLLAAFAVGGIAERVVARFFRESKQRLIAQSSFKLWTILKILYTRLTYDLLGVLAFAIGSSIVIFRYYEAGSLVSKSAYVFTATVMGGWMAYVVCRFFFAPRRPDLRICNTSDHRAWKITISFSLLAAFVVFIHNVFKLFIQLSIEETDVGPPFMAPLGFWMSISMYVAAAAVIWYNRAGLSEILLENKKRVSVAIGDDAPEDLSWFAVNWPKIAILLIVCKYFMVEFIISSSNVGVYSTGAVYITFVVIFLWPGIDANVSLFVSKGVSIGENESATTNKARRQMQRGLLRVGRIVVVGIVLYSLASLWGLNLLDLAQSGLGAQVAGVVLEFLLIILISYICWELVSAVLGHWMAVEGGQVNEEEADAGGEIGGVGLSRVATLLPIIRRTAQFLIVVVTIIMVLDNWGINTGPILAGAGVVGLAIGFGAQTLVKDIVSGMFFLADDAFRVGEYIDVGGTMGSVEKISLRSLRLRHHKGLVHTIPYGEIPKLTNFSRDWVIVKLRFRVPFDADIHKIKKIFKVIGADLLADPVLGDDFLQPFKSQGVAEVDDNGIVVRGKFMAKPGKQFMIRKEVYVRVQKAFDEAGIPFARKQVMVHIPGLDKAEELDKDQLKSIGAAAAESADEPPPAKG